MASEGVLRTEDIIEKGIFKDAIEGGKALEQQIKSIYAVIENKGAASQNFLSTFIPKNLGDIQKANAEMAKSNTLIDSKIKLSEAEAKIVALQAKAEAEQAKARRENEKVSQEELKTKILNTKETERQERATKKLSGAYFEAKKALNEISNEIKNLTVAGQSTAHLDAEFKKLFKSVSEAEQKVGQYNRNVGNYKQSTIEAIESTGLFGEALEKLKAGYTALQAVRELIFQGFEKEKEVENAAKIAVEEETIAQEVQNTVEKENIVLTEEQTLAQEENIVATNAETAAIEKQTLAKRALNAVTSTTGLIIAGILLLTKVIYDNLTATQKQKDVQDALEESTKESAKYLDVKGVSVKQLAKDVYNLTLAEKELQDEIGRAHV